MINPQDTSDLLPLELTPPEGAALLDFVEDLLNELDDEDHLVNLTELEDKLGDANAIALWLREYVRVELSLHERIDLLDALTVRLMEDQKLGDREILSQVEGKLRRAVGAA